MKEKKVSDFLTQMKQKFCQVRFSRHTAMQSLSNLALCIKFLPPRDWEFNHWKRDWTKLSTGCRLLEGSCLFSDCKQEACLAFYVLCCIMNPPFAEIYISRQNVLSRNQNTLKNAITPINFNFSVTMGKTTPQKGLCKEHAGYLGLPFCFVGELYIVYPIVTKVIALVLYEGKHTLMHQTQWPTTSRGATTVVTICVNCFV